MGRHLSKWNSIERGLRQAAARSLQLLMLRSIPPRLSAHIYLLLLLLLLLLPFYLIYNNFFLHFRLRYFQHTHKISYWKFSMHMFTVSAPFVGPDANASRQRHAPLYGRLVAEEHLPAAHRDAVHQVSFAKTFILCVLVIASCFFSFEIFVPSFSLSLLSFSVCSPPSLGDPWNEESLQTTTATMRRTADAGENEKEGKKSIERKKKWCELNASIAVNNRKSS